METQTPVNGQENICWLEFCDIFKLNADNTFLLLLYEKDVLVLLKVTIMYIGHLKSQKTEFVLFLFWLYFVIWFLIFALSPYLSTHPCCLFSSSSAPWWQYPTYKLWCYVHFNVFSPLAAKCFGIEVIITQVTTERNYSATLSYAYWLSFITYRLLTHIPVRHSSLRTSFMQPFNGPVFRRVVAVNHRMVQ